MTNNRGTFYKIHLGTQRGRRWAVAIASLFPVFYFVITFGDRPSLLSIMQVFIVGGALGGISGCGPVKPFEGGKTRLIRSSFFNDEFDIARRDHAHYIAYKFWRRVITVASLAFYAFHRLAGGSFAHWHLWPVEQEIFEALIVPVAVAFFMLPSAILLWTETDAAPEDDLAADACVLASRSSGLIL